MSKGLETLKTLRTVNQREFGNDKNVNNSYDIIEKELKALEIITSKVMFSMLNFKYCDTVEEYNQLYSENSRLTQEEFDLLKEVID